MYAEFLSMVCINRKVTANTAMQPRTKSPKHCRKEASSGSRTTQQVSGMMQRYQHACRSRAHTRQTEKEHRKESDLPTIKPPQGATIPSRCQHLQTEKTRESLQVRSAAACTSNNSALKGKERKRRSIEGRDTNAKTEERRSGRQKQEEEKNDLILQILSSALPATAESPVSTEDRQERSPQPNSLSYLLPLSIVFHLGAINECPLVQEQFFPRSFTW
mmetsp:Transcript_38988/g.76627  ORF Transcript_38988/g.76627 Transcript_38988/m.76627 type:complete len:218 (+) Transcript_38988:372-1025(+)